MNKKRGLLWLFFFGPAVISVYILLILLSCLVIGIASGIRDFLLFQKKLDPKKVVVSIAGGILQVGVFLCLL